MRLSGEADDNWYKGPLPEGPVELPLAVDLSQASHILAYNYALILWPVFLQTRQELNLSLDEGRREIAGMLGSFISELDGWIITLHSYRDLWEISHADEIVKDWRL